jgi:glycosyltransferase involved in cell wall biosynthesis
MHFVYVDRSCKLSGGTTYVLLLAQGLTQRGHQFTYAARGGPLSGMLAEVGARHLRTLSWPLNVPHIAWYLRRHPCEVMMCSGRGRAREAALGLARKLGLPCIAFLHDPLQPHTTLEELLRPTALVTMERPIYQAALEIGVPAERIRLWPRPIRSRALQPPAEDSFRVVYMGRLSHHKYPSAEALIAAVPELVRELKELRVSIVGKGTKLPTIRARADEVNQECGREVVEVVGETLDPLGWMERAHVVVAGGYTCMEALYTGRPALASGYAWMGPVSRENFAAAASSHFGDRAEQPPTPEKMAAGIREMYQALQEPNRKDRLLPRPEWFDEDHSIEGTARLVEELARELTEGDPPPRAGG